MGLRSKFRLPTRELGKLSTSRSALEQIQVHAPQLHALDGNPAFALFVRAAEAFMVQPPRSLPSSSIRSAMFIEQ
jgi:hypothetical protein